MRYVCVSHQLPNKNELHLPIVATCNVHVEIIFSQIRFSFVVVVGVPCRGCYG